MKKGTMNKTTKTTTTAKKPEASKEQSLEEIVATLITEEYNKLDQMHRVLCEIRDLLKAGQTIHHEYHMPPPRWTETPGWDRNREPTPGQIGKHWPTDPWGSPVPYCGHGGDRIYCGCGHERYETMSSAEDRPRRFRGYRK